MAEMKAEIEQLEETVKKNDKKVKKQDSEISEMKAEIEELMKKNDDLRKKVKTLNQEIEEKNDDIDELGKTLRSKDREIRALKVLDADDASSLELQKLRRQKEELLRESREKDMELKRLKEDIDELGKTLRSKDREIRALKMLEADDASSLKLQKLRRQNEELQRQSREKDKELERLKEVIRKMKDESSSVTTYEDLRTLLAENAREIGSLQNENESLKNQLKRCNNTSTKLSWGIYDNIKYVKELGEAQSYQIHLSARQRVLPNVFNFSNELAARHYDMPTSESSYTITAMVDEDRTTNHWPRSPVVQMYMLSSSYPDAADVRRRHFDADNWYFIKTAHPEGGLTMMAYYDGNLNRALVSGQMVPLPFTDMVFKTLRI